MREFDARAIDVRPASRSAARAAEDLRRLADAAARMCAVSARMLEGKVDREKARRVKGG